MKLFEAVPNLSQGRDTAWLAQATQLLQGRPGLWLLGVDAGTDANRSVFTLVGEGPAMAQGLFDLYAFAAESLDMNQHQGNHPVIGALDVCPLVPLAQSSMADAQALALHLGEQVSTRLAIPLYLYQNSSLIQPSRSLSQIRKGGFTQLARRMFNGNRPDLGPHQPHPRFGAGVLGARPLMIAYNINLSRADLEQARALAHQLRNLRDQPESTRLQGVELLGWWLDRFHLAQISCNLRQYQICGMADVFFKVKRQAARMDISVTGSELVGLTPLNALLETRYSDPLAEASALDEALLSLGLGDLQDFDPATKILEYRLQALGGPCEI